MLWLVESLPPREKWLEEELWLCEGGGGTLNIGAEGTTKPLLLMSNGATEVEAEAEAEAGGKTGDLEALGGVTI